MYITKFFLSVNLFYDNLIIRQAKESRKEKEKLPPCWKL